ncbi:MAG: pantoate--beta-alanine ligase [Deltaproteobacteria bacterium]|nr:pantoate--beta-alanine ligase [Deltaproteobacteria bacterium]MCL5792534.1 pantoate--beta-alanine ligase [Deltaproteobacteria bacterium]
MRTITHVKEMQRFSIDQRMEGKKIVLVPTMGYLHDGHLSLLKKGRAMGDILVMSLFVNPLQFALGEDLNRYPRDFNRDENLAEQAQTDVVFCPSGSEMYTDDFKTEVVIKDLSNILCGKTRPGHFKGVATVVLKLFNIVMPHVALFGEKDFQQLVIIKRMIEDLNVSVDIIGMPIVREPDGLAMSSRNVYLSGTERKNALSISRGLYKSLDAYKEGMRDKAQLISIVRKEIADAGLKEDYIEIIDEKTLEPVPDELNSGRIVAAVYAGNTRLIDNMSLKNVNR